MRKNFYSKCLEKIFSTFSEHEGSRRMKTELLMQMDGLAKTDDLVFLLAASNLPWYAYKILVYQCRFYQITAL